MLKPDTHERGLIGEIISRFEKRGFQILNLKMLDSQNPHVSVLLKAHCEAFENKSFYGDLISFLHSGPIVIMMLKGNIETAKEIVGSTIPSDAKAGSIRGDYACSLPSNLVHCSHSAEEAAAEVELWSAMFI